MTAPRSCATPTSNWQRLAAVPEALNLLDAAIKRKPGQDQERDPETGRMLPNVDNVNVQPSRPVGNSADAGLRRLRELRCGKFPILVIIFRRGSTAAENARDRGCIGAGVLLSGGNMAFSKPRYSVADVIMASHLAGAGKSAAEITAALRFPCIRSTYDLLSRYGISLLPKNKGQTCIRLVVSETAAEAGMAVAAAQERDPARAMSLALEELLLSPNTFKELLAAAERRRK